MSDDTSDIVERLKLCAEGKLCPSVAEEAADEIERWQAETEKLAALHSAMVVENMRLREENAGLRKALEVAMVVENMRLLASKDASQEPQRT